MKPNEKVIKFEHFQISGTKGKVTFKTSINDFRKLDGVGPVDNRPSINKLHHLKKKKMTCDM